MSEKRIVRQIFSSLSVLTLIAGSAPALAYIGPGLGLGALGAVIGVVVAVLLAILGLFWYPIKRLLKKPSKNAAATRQAPPPTEAQANPQQPRAGESAPPPSAPEHADRR